MTSHKGRNTGRDIRPRRLLIVTPNFPPHIGGIERVAWAEATELAAAGEEVRVLTSGFGEASPDEAGMAAVRCVPAWNGLEARFGIPFPMFSPSLMIHCWRLVLWADIVHIHDIRYMSSWVSAAWCRATRTPLLVTQHAGIVAHHRRSVVAIQRTVYATLGRLVLRTARLVAANNSRVADFLRTLNVPSSRIALLTNGTDTGLFRPGAARAKPRSFVRNSTCQSAAYSCSMWAASLLTRASTGFSRRREANTCSF